MHTKSTTLIVTITFALFLILIVAGLVYIFPTLSICHSSQKIPQFKVANPIFSPDGSRIAFTDYYTIKRPPVGICTFPDGGKHLIVHNELRIYTVSQKTNKVDLSVQIPVKNNDVLNESAYGLLGWEDNTIYLWMFYPNDGSGVRHYFQSNIKQGQYKEISSQKGKDLEEKYWGQARFNPNNESEWLEYDAETNSVNVYEGGKWQMDKNRKSLFQSGYPQTTHVKTIVGSSVIQQIQSLLD